MWIFFFRNDCTAYGPFASEEEASAWAKDVPNVLFSTQEGYEDADTNADFIITRLIPVR